MEHPCPFCHALLYNLVDFGHHLKEVHICSKCQNFQNSCSCIWNCEFCSIEFQTRLDLTLHVQDIHTCNICFIVKTDCTCQDTQFVKLVKDLESHLQKDTCQHCRKNPCTCGGAAISTNEECKFCLPNPCDCEVVARAVYDEDYNVERHTKQDQPHCSKRKINDQGGESLIKRGRVEVVDQTSLVIREPASPANPGFITVESIRSKYCCACDITFPLVRDLQHHLVMSHPEYYDGVEIAQLGMGTSDTLNLILSKTAFDAYHEFCCDMNNVVAKDVLGVFHSLRPQLLNLRDQYLSDWCTFKVQFIITLLMSKEQSDENGEIKKIYQTPTFQGFMFPVTCKNNFNSALKVTIDHLRERIEEYVKNGSGWNLEKISNFTTMIVRYDPFSGGSREKLPDILKKKNYTLVSVPADDNLCFARAIYAHKDVHRCELGAKNVNRTLQRKEFYKKKLFNGFINWDGIEFPFSLKQVNKFEKQNPHIALTIIGFSSEFSEKRKKLASKVQFSDHKTVDQCIHDVVDARVDSDEASEKGDDDVPRNTSSSPEVAYRAHQKIIRSHCMPLHISKSCENKIMIDLLLLLDTEGSEHYVHIKSLHGLLATHNFGTKHICRHCLQCFNEDYDIHVLFCVALGNQKTIFPEKTHLKFEQFSRTQKAPFTIIADFEAFPVPSGDVIIQDPESPQSETIKIATHEPCGYSWKVIDWKGKLLDQRVYRLTDIKDADGKQVNDVAKRFLTEMIVINKEYQDIMKEYEKEAKKTMKISEKDEENFRTRRALGDCYFCHKEFTSEDVSGGKVVRHHSHLEPYNFEGFAHQTCNVLAYIPKKISVIFHNLKGYDGHFLVQAATSDIVEDIEVIPQTGEKFMSIIVNKSIKFIDSALFMPESLDSLVKNMDKEKDFDILRQAFPDCDKEQVNMLLEKGAYPYSYMTGVDKFCETALPCIEHFRNDLTRKRLNIEVYRHAEKVWKAFKIKDMGAWHDLYVKCDTALLACVWFKLRNCLYDNYGLDVNHYFSLPMFSLDASLKMTGVELEFIKDPTMHVWLESAIRGGLVSAGDLRVAKANNKYLPDYNKKKPSSYLVYWDANNLYGTALSQYLPYGKFKWADAKEMEHITSDPRGFVLGNSDLNMRALGDEDETGWFFEVDLHVPDNLHDYLNSYPPAPCSRVVNEKEISYMQHELGIMIGANMQSKEKRLIADLKPKLNYVCHYRALRRWLQLGVEVTTVHRALKFEQKPWMKQFVDFNTAKRQQATSEIDKKFYKLMNNTGYGKLIEQKRNRTRIQVVLTEEKALRLNKKPTVDHVTILDNNTVLLTMKRMQVTLDRPIAAGVAVLDISKVIMFDFHYDFIVPTYKDQEGRPTYYLLYTDTDSLIYLIQTENIYDDCKKYEDKFFDMSEYNPKDPILGKYYSAKNKKRLGYFTDETPQGVISEVVINKPKMYCVRTLLTKNNVLNNGEYTLKKKAKGIGRSAVENDITFKNYVNAIDPTCSSEAQTFADTKTIRSFKHKIFTIDSRKKAINGHDIKRYSPDGIVTFAYGHKDIPLYENDYKYDVDIDLDNNEVEARKIASDFVDSFSN